MTSAIALYHQTKTPISFLCKQRLNPKSLIQPSKTLPIELTRTHLIQEPSFKLLGRHPLAICIHYAHINIKRFLLEEYNTTKNL